MADDTLNDIVNASRSYGPKRTTVNGDLTEQFDPLTVMKLNALIKNQKRVQCGMASLQVNVALPKSPCNQEGYCG